MDTPDKPPPGSRLSRRLVELNEIGVRMDLLCPTPAGHLEEGWHMTNPSELPAELLKQSPPIADLLQALSHDGPFERAQSAVNWGRAALPSETVRNLLALLNDPDRDVRVVAVTALGDYGGEAHRA